jgi:cobalt-zinc-cadmium resistance protein CzcA
VPGNRYEFLQPIQMRFNELLSGVRAELAIKIFGDDLSQLETLGGEIQNVIGAVDDIVDIQMEQTTGLSMLTLKPKQSALGQYAVELNSLQDQVATAMGGQGAGFFYEGDRRAEIVVRLPEDRRNDIDQLGSLPIQVSSGGYVPLKELVDIGLTTGLNQVNRENGKRRVVVTANVRGRDLGSFVSDVKAIIESQVTRL